MAKKPQKAAAGKSKEPATDFVPHKSPHLAAAFALILPGAGHFFLGDRRRGLLLGGLIFLCLFIGCRLEGLLMWQFGGSPLLVLGTLGSAGAGLPFLVLHFAGYTGNPTAAGFEYGASFLLSAGLLNWLLVLDAWDRGWGRKSSLVDGTLEEEPSA